MNKIKSTIVNYAVIISFLLYSSPSFSMMNCVGNDFYCEDYKNGTILCRPTSFTCKPPDNEWSWAASGMTYAFASAVFSFTLDRLWEFCKKRLYVDEKELINRNKNRSTELTELNNYGSTK